MEKTKILAIGASVALVGSLVWAGVAQSNSSNSAVALSDMTAKLSTFQTENGELSSSIDSLNADIASFGVTIDELNAVIEENAQVIEDYKAAEEAQAIEDAAEEAAEEAEEAEEIIANAGYDVDEFGLAKTITEDITENDYEVLLDSEVRFDGDDYDFEEVLSFMATSDINGDDYNEDTYLTVDENDFTYKLIFDSDLDTSLICEDETVDISFLGKEIEILKWDNTEITIDNSEAFLVNKGDSIEFMGKIITLDMVGDDFVIVNVDGITDSIKEDKTEEINDLDIKLDFAAEGVMANLKISDANEENVINSGDEFAEDSMWEYVITPNSIGLILTEDFNDIDEDSDYKALAAGESISLPNDYLSLTYNGIKSVDYKEIDFSEKNGFVKIKGDFTYGLEDYDLVYANVSGFYDEDYTLISTDNIEVDKTDSLIELKSGNKLLKINDIRLNLDFSDALVNGNSVLSKDDNYRSSYGIIVDAPEDDLEDEKFSISVPEERVEVGITIN